MDHGRTTLRNSGLRHFPIKVSGIYRITNSLDTKFYIGSARNIRRRLRMHLMYLRKGTHASAHLQHAYNRDGEAVFTFELIEEVAPESLYEREQYWLDATRCYDDNIGYNICRVAGPPPKVIYTEEMRARISARMKGKPKSEEHRRKIGEAHCGQKHPPEQIEKQREGARAYWSSPENRAAQSERKKGCHAHNKGKAASLDAVEKARKTRLEFWSNPENMRTHLARMKKRRKFTDEQITQWMALRAQGHSYLSISVRYEVSETTIRKCVLRESQSQEEINQ